MRGETNTDETAECEAKIRELTAELDRQGGTHNMLNAQIKRLQAWTHAYVT